MPLIDRHHAKHGQLLWALINGRPLEVRFKGLLPYAGFKFSTPDKSEAVMFEANTEAIFANTQDDLVNLHIKRELDKITEAEAVIARLGEMLERPMWAWRAMEKDEYPRGVAGDQVRHRQEDGRWSEWETTCWDGEWTVGTIIRDVDNPMEFRTKRAEPVPQPSPQV